MKLYVKKEDWSRGKIVNSKNYVFDLELQKRIEIATHKVGENVAFGETQRFIEHSELWLAFTVVQITDNDVVIKFEGDMVTSYIDPQLSQTYAFAKLEKGDSDSIRSNTKDSGTTVYFELK